MDDLFSFNRIVLTGKYKTAYNLVNIQKTHPIIMKAKFGGWLTCPKSKNGPK